MDDSFNELLKAYGIAPDSCKLSSIGTGHVHDTYVVSRSGSNDPPLVLQRMNDFVFKDVALLMHNLELVSAHIAYKNRNLSRDPACCGIVLLESDEGESWIGNQEAGYWRMFWFIENQVAYDYAPDARIAYEGGKAIADFQRMLSDLDPEKIKDTIPGFHDLNLRADQFNNALSNASAERKEHAAEIIALYQALMTGALSVYRDSKRLKIPFRITHNDTKFNNILFHKSTGKANCLIDLDTVMKGYSWFDFGDSLRTCASVTPEDEPDVDKIDFKLDIFEGFTKGFLEVGKNFLTKAEISLLHKAPGVFSYIMGLRFLTDFLNNDIYYKTAFPEHNFQRARAQLVLTQRILIKEDRMQKIVAEAAS